MLIIFFLHISRPRPTHAHTHTDTTNHNSGEKKTYLILWTIKTKANFMINKINPKIFLINQNYTQKS